MHARFYVAGYQGIEGVSLRSCVHFCMQEQHIIISIYMYGTIRSAPGKGYSFHIHLSCNAKVDLDCGEEVSLLPGNISKSLSFVLTAINVFFNLYIQVQRFNIQSDASPMTDPIKLITANIAMKS